MTGMGNEAQVRMVAEQVAAAAVERFDQTHPRHLRAEVPPPLKWAAGIVAAVASACMVAMAIWIVSTLSSLQQTVTRIDERQQLTGDSTDKRLDDQDRRIGRLEALHQQKGERQ